MFENFDLDTVVTPVNVQKYNSLLIDSGYDPEETQFLVQGFKFGFDIGYRCPIEGVRRYAPNLKLRVGNKTILWNKVMKEVQLGRYARLYKEPPYKNFIQSPIRLVPKDNGDTRLIFHLSNPRNGDSINSLTPKELCSVKYPDLSEAIIRCMEEINDGESPCFIGKSDMKSAFRQLGLKVDQFGLLIMKAESPIDGKTYFFIEKALSFGASISCSHSQRFSNSIAHITKVCTRKSPVNYMDDFYFCAMMKKLCDWQLHIFLEICDYINFPVSLGKTYWGTQILAFLGLLINTISRMVGIPADKVERALYLIEEILKNKSRKTTVHRLQKLCGFLNFLCQCIYPGRTFTRRLYAHFSSKLAPHHHIRVTGEMKEDLRTWQVFLKEPMVYCRPFMDFSRVLIAEDLDWYTDTSGRIGYGGILQNEFFYGQWPLNFLLRKFPSIEYLELYAVAVSVLLWARYFQNRRICLYCDNETVKNWSNNSSAGCKNSMKLIRLIVLESMRWNMRIFAKWVKSEHNGFVNALSRMQLGRFRQLARE